MPGRMTPRLDRRPAESRLRTAVEDERGPLGAEAELGAQLDAVLRAQVGDVVLAVVDDLGADIGELARGEAFADGEYSSADAVACLEHDNVVAGLLRFGGGDEPGETGPDDEHPHKP